MRRRSRVAALVVATGEAVNADRLSRVQRSDFISETGAVLSLLADRSADLSHALERLRDRIAGAGARAAHAGPTASCSLPSPGI